MTTRSLLAVLLALIASLPAAAGAQASNESSRAAPAAFADPQRLAKLSAAFPQVDSVMQAFAARSRVPGIAYGIVVDGRLVHVGTAGYRELASRALTLLLLQVVRQVHEFAVQEPEQ